MTKLRTISKLAERIEFSKPVGSHDRVTATVVVFMPNVTLFNEHLADWEITDYTTKKVGNYLHFRLAVYALED